jgi:Leucine-rich repeat (LRR) protein
MDHLSELPDDLLRHVAQFAMKSLNDFARAHRISRHIKSVLHDPAMLSYIWFKFKSWKDVDGIGALRSGIHQAQQYGGRAANISAALCLMPNLQKLSLHDIWIVTEDLNYGLSHTIHLTTLSLACLNMVQHLELPQTTQVLHVQGCATLRSISNAPNLLELHVSYCNRLRSIPSLESLTVLKMAACRIEVPSGLMPNLRQLDTDFFLSSRNAPHAIASCTALENVRMYSDVITSLSFLAPLTNLHSLVMWQCNALQDLRGLSGLSSLARLQLSGCRLSDMSLLSLERLQKLTYLELESDALTNDGLSSVAKLLALKELYINCCKLTSNGLRRLAPLQSLEVFHLTRAFYVEDISPLSRLTNLRNVQLSSLIQLGSVEPLSSLPLLSSVTLEHCRVLNSLQGLGKLPLLDYLCLDGCDSITRTGLWALMPAKGTLTNFLMCDAMRTWFTDDLSQFYRQLRKPQTLNI